MPDECVEVQAVISIDSRHQVQFVCNLNSEQKQKFARAVFATFMSVGKPPIKTPLPPTFGEDHTTFVVGGKQRGICARCRVQGLDLADSLYGCRHVFWCCNCAEYRPVYQATDLTF